MYRDSHGPIDMIVTLAIPEQVKLVHGVGAAPSDHYEPDEPAGTQVFRLEFETYRDAMDHIAGTASELGCLSIEKLVAEEISFWKKPS